LIGLAVIRTHLLVRKALDEITKDETQPSYRYQKEVKFPGNANKILVWVPVILTIFFICATIHYSLRGAHIDGNTRNLTVFGCFWGANSIPISPEPGKGSVSLSGVELS
jgi:hypothetical protein